jgi:hypothetical protein
VVRETFDDGSAYQYVVKKIDSNCSFITDNSALISCICLLPIPVWISVLSPILLHFDCARDLVQKSLVEKLTFYSVKR